MVNGATIGKSSSGVGTKKKLSTIANKTITVPGKMSTKNMQGSQIVNQ